MNKLDYDEIENKENKNLEDSLNTNNQNKVKYDINAKNENLINSNVK